MIFLFIFRCYSQIKESISKFKILVNVFLSSEPERAWYSLMKYKGFCLFLFKEKNLSLHPELIFVLTPWSLFSWHIFSILWSRSVQQLVLGKKKRNTWVLLVLAGNVWSPFSYYKDHSILQQWKNQSCALYNRSK